MLNYTAFAHVVFVDFENVPNIDLDIVADRPVAVVLLIGRNQGRFDLRLVRQIHRYSAQVDLIEVGASGHNALDLTLAYYLGRSAAQAPQTHFYIVSKDKDFDPLLAHLNRNDVRVSRHGSLNAVPALASPARPAATPTPPPADDKLDKITQTLRASARARPKTRKSLLRHINAAFGNALSHAELDELVAGLARRNILRVDDGKVSYE